MDLYLYICVRKDVERHEMSWDSVGEPPSKFELSLPYPETRHGTQAANKSLPLP
jgi:hypothetical protein